MPQEVKVLSDKAKANGMNEAEYIRLLISQKPNDYPEVRKLLKELINEVNRIGININQIVFNSNAQLYSKKDKDSRMAAPKMQTALDYYEKGVPIDAIREVVQKDDTAVNMRRMFDV